MSRSRRFSPASRSLRPPMPAGRWSSSRTASTGSSASRLPEAIAAAVNRLAGDRARAASLGLAGFERARSITWDRVIEKLVE